jgi:hypothetical protein
MNPRNLHRAIVPPGSELDLRMKDHDKFTWLPGSYVNASACMINTCAATAESVIEGGTLRHGSLVFCS